MDSNISAHRSVRRRQARRLVCRVTDEWAKNRKTGEDSHRLVVGCPISGGVWRQRAPTLVLGRNRGNLHRLAVVRGPRHPLYRVPKPQQMQPAVTNKLTKKHRHKRESHTRRVTAHLSDCSGGMVFFLFGGSTHGRAGRSRPPHQLLAVSGV